MSWKKYKFGDFLTRSKIPVDIQDEKEYKRVTIKTKHQGISVRDIEKGKKIGTKKQFILKAGQFVLSKIDARYGAFGIAPEDVDDAIITGNFWAYDVDFSIINIEWFNQFTNSQDFYDVCERASTGITHRKYLNEAFFLNYEIDLPETSAQLKIIEDFKKNKDVDLLLSEGLTHQLDLVKQLRQAFLREAMQGKLTSKWRDENPDVEPASELLKKIKAEKENLVKEGKLKKQKPLPPIKEDEIPFEIPESWEWCKVDALVSDINKDIRTGPFGTALNKSEHKAEGVPVWGIESISKNGQFTFRNKIFVTNEKAIKLKSFEVYGGDLIISRTGTIGELCMLPYTTRKGLLSTNLMKISFDKRMMLPELFCHIIKGTSYIEDMLRDFCSGSTRLFLTQKILKRLVFPLPPLSEQQQIVRKLGELVQYCDKLEESIKTSQQQNEMLLQQVLREALEKN